MINGRTFTAHFEDQTSRSAYLTWSAAQMLVYNAKVQENNYFWRFHQKFWTPEPLPKPDQKYAHFHFEPWVTAVPSAVRGIGAYRWFQAQNAFMRGITRRPRAKKIKGADRQLTLTQTYFTFEPISKKWTRLVVGTKSKGTAFTLRIRTHRGFEMPAMIAISSTNAGVRVSFSYEAEDVPETETPETQEEIAKRLQPLPVEELEEKTLAWDWGVVINVACSDGKCFLISTVEQERMKRKERGRLRHQRRLARMQADSNNARKQKQRIAKDWTYERNVRTNFAHQVSHALATREDIEVIGCEALNVKGMTKRPKPKYDKNGKPLPNGAVAKAGLNRSLLKSQKGRISQYLHYKCAREGKLFVQVDPKNSSRECCVCGHIARENRPEQAVFRCTNPDCPNYGVEINADLQAALVLKKRTVEAVRAGIKQRESKKLLRVPRAKKGINVGVDRPESLCAPKPVEPSLDASDAKAPRRPSAIAHASA